MLGFRPFSARASVAAIGVLIAVGLGYRAEAQIVTADGNLDDEARLTLFLTPPFTQQQVFIQNPQYVGKGVAFFVLDGTRPADIDGASGPGDSAGSDGFRDAGLAFFAVPPCDTCTDNAPIFPSLNRSPMNTGKLTIIYLGNSTNSLATDDSLLYVGFDIFNADRRDVGDPNFFNNGPTQNIRWHHIDFTTDPNSGATICANGVADYNNNGIPDFFGVPFDTDGDGSPFTLTRWSLVPPPGSCLPQTGVIEQSAGTFKEYQLRLFVCPPSDFVPPPRDIIGFIRVKMEGLSPIVTFETTANLNVPGVVYETFPANGRNLQTNPIGTDPNDRRRDVEFVIRKFDTLINAQFPADGYGINRLRAAQAGIQTLSDSQQDQSAEDIISARWLIPLPQVEVKKTVRCPAFGGDPNDPNIFKTSVVVDPNARVEFRIEVENTGNVPLAVNLADTLTEFAPADFVPDPNTLIVTLFRPGNAAGQNVTAANAATFTPRMNPAFFGPAGFLGNLNGTPVCLGTLNGVNVCGASIVPGDRVVVRFQGDLRGNPCSPARVVDVSNAVTAIGDPDVVRDPIDPNIVVGPCADPNGVPNNETRDVHSVIDTPRETAQGFDDNVATVNILCRGITLVKDARVCTSCTDPNSPAACSAFADPLTLPSVPAGGLCVQYRYRVTNNTDPNESPDPNFTTETVRIFDNQLCTDALAVGATIGPCDVCPAGSAPFPVLAGQTVTKTCTIKFATQAILDAFIARNDPNRPCPPAGFNDPRPGGHGAGAGPTSPFGPGEAVSGDAIIRVSEGPGNGGDDPADEWSDDADPERDTRAGCGCYRNCATATATNAAACPGTPRGAFDTAQICKTSCTLEVGKKVECLDCDPNRPTTCFSPTDPNNACPPSGLADPNEPNLLQASQGSRIRYTVTVRNVLDPNCGNIPLCRILFRDLLNPNDPNCVAIDPNTARIVRANGSEFTVPGFNVAGNSFNLLLSSVGGNLPATAAGDPNGALRLRFDGRVGPNANPACDPNNTVTVWGLIPVDGNCPTLADPNDPNLYTCFAGDTARVDVRRVGLTALKQWSAVWDDDANCDPNDPNDPNTGFRTCLNLRDIVFPAILTLRVTGTNTGEDDLCVDPNDPSIACVIGKPGITVLQNEFIPPVSKVITPAGSATWVLRIRVDSAAAARSLASCGSGNDPNDPNCQCGTADPNCPPCYRNTVTLRGRVIPKGRICPVDTSATASATVCPPPECKLDVTKQVVCVNCADPNVQIGTVADHVDALPGSCQKFIIRITNTGLVKLPQLRIDDDLTLAAGLTPDIVDTASVRARIIPTVGAPVNVTACFSTFGDNVKTGTAACYKFAACRPLAPWLAPGEVLEITFKITIPPAFVDGGTPVDVTNTVNVRGYTEACDSVCGTASVCDKTDSSTVNVKKPSLICDKALGQLPPDVVFDPNIPSTFPPGGFTNDLQIQINDPNLPIQLVYRYGVTNNGEVRMVNVALIDDELVKDAKFANATFGLCQLCDVAGCDGVNDTTIPFGTLNVAESKVGYCAITFPTGTDLLNFLRTDDEPNSPDPNDPNCYVNRARPRGEPNEPNVCLPIPNPLFEPNAFCEAKICVGVNECVCPPTKADVLVWNEDEISLGGMHRCVYAWDERYASNWTWGYPGVPNIWTIAALHTNSAFAQIDGVASPSVCGDCSIAAPFIGTFFHVIQFYDPNSTDPNAPYKVEYAGGAMAGKGLQAGQLKVPFDANGGPESVKQAGRPTPGVIGIDLPPAGGGGGGGQRSGGEQPDDANAPSTIRVSTSTKGSLLIYPKVEVKWNAQGKVIQDTFIQVNNDNRNAGVHVNMLWINGNDPNLCDSEHFDTDFTHQQAVWFSAALGTPLGAVPFPLVAPRIPDTDPRNPGGTRVHGALLIWAVDLTGKEIKWNHLFGEATIVNYKLAAAIDYNAYAFRAIAGADDGALLLEPYGTLDLNAIEYDMPANTLVFPFFAVDAVIYPTNGGKFRVLDIDIALMPLLRDYRTQTHP